MNKLNINLPLFDINFWKMITSPTAIIVYLVLILVIIISLVLVTMSNEKKRVEEQNSIKEAKKSQASNEVVDKVDLLIDKKLLAVKSHLVKQDEKMDEILDKPSFGLPTGKNIKAMSTTSSNEEVLADGESRFCMLTSIDERFETYEEPKFNEKISLKEICEQFRNFSSYKLNLYYDITDIRRFIGGLAVTKLLILQGMSGTGKTSLAYAFGEFLNNETVIVPIQPMWKERTDLVGYYNEFTRKFNETTLLRKMYEANCNRQIYCTVLDEMNIARIEYYFAEFLSLLEIPNPDGRNLEIVSDVWDNDPKLLNEGRLRLPINMWFIGTANNDDSTFAISDKVYDRAMVLNLDKKAEVFEAPKTEPLNLSVDHLYELFIEAQKEFDISDRNLRRIEKLDKYLIDTFHITFGNRIMKQIRAYVPVLVACGGNELEALDDILSRKVLRKLESKNPVYVRSQSAALCNFIDDLFGADRMVLCKETIRNIEQNV